jgi:hypothetical protein
MARGRVRQHVRHRPRGSSELVVQAADQGRADEVIGAEAGNAQTDEEEGDRDDENP